MTKKIFSKTFLFSFILIYSFLMLCSFSIAFGAIDAPNDTLSLPNSDSINDGNSTFSIDNPIKANNIQQFLSDILTIVVKIGTPFLVLMVIYTGFRFVEARGNPGKLGKAQDAAKGLLIGAFVVLGAFAISQALQNTVQQLAPFELPNIGVR